MSTQFLGVSRSGFIEREIIWCLHKLRERPNEILDIIDAEQQRELSGEIIDMLMRAYEKGDILKGAMDAVNEIKMNNRNFAEKLASEEADKNGL